MPATVEDRRTGASTSKLWVCCTDRFLSGWGKASGGRSYYCLQVTPDTADIVLENARHRSDMVRARLTSKPTRGRDGDHVALVDQGSADRWFQPGAWK